MATTTVKKDLPKLFCTVLREFKPDGVTPIWKVNQTLQSRLEQLLDSQPSLATEDECTIYWIDIYRHQERTKPLAKLAESFLCYYLQQIAYHVAHRMYNSSPSGGSNNERSSYKKDELFAIASAKIPKIIQNFDPQAIGEFTAGSGSRLGAYSHQVFRNAIRAAVSLQQVDRLSDWGLIVYGISPSYLTKALQEQGCTQIEIDTHRLMLQSFQQIHRVTGAATRNTVETEWNRNRRLAEPDDEQIQATIGCYNLLRHDRPQYQHLPPLAESSGDLVKDCLLQCARAVRAAKQEPQLVSLNKFLGQEDTELGDLIPDLQTPSPIVVVEQNEFLAVLGNLAIELSPQWQRAMKLIYGEGLNQSAVAIECGVDQGTVSRWQKGNRGKGGWLRTLQEKLAHHYEPHIPFAPELLDPVMGTEVLEYYLELLYSKH
jgi:RNA polymerase sigma factor (sigma-70 family)